MYFVNSNYISLHLWYIIFIIWLHQHNYFYAINLLHVLAFWQLSHIKQFTFTLSSTADFHNIGRCFYLGIIFSLVYTNVPILKSVKLRVLLKNGSSSTIIV
jgi:hypothetical protein